MLVNLDAGGLEVADWTEVLVDLRVLVRCSMLWYA